MISGEAWARCERESLGARFSDFDGTDLSICLSVSVWVSAVCQSASIRPTDRRDWKRRGGKIPQNSEEKKIALFSPSFLPNSVNSARNDDFEGTKIEEPRKIHKGRSNFCSRGSFLDNAMTFRSPRRKFRKKTERLSWRALDSADK